MAQQSELKMFGLTVLAVLAAFILAVAASPFVASAADAPTDQTASFVMQEDDEDEDENGEEEEAAEEDDDAAVEDDEEAEDTEGADVGPAETGSAGLIGGQSGLTVAAMILGIGAVLALVSAGRLATRRQ